ncbi:MAG: aminoacyl-tRNA hydrolase [Bacteroidales bacterium]|nr:aminoacyl-tRNA hydrolase [Bacteroidales bacterium]MBN2758342.1 aminoacyl-tRNA hydrolase [Bacteroidales bacterium]
MKYLIVGLGNIGEKYANTRHNIGFKILDYLALQNDIEFKQNRLAFTAEWKFKGRSLMFCKPTTYMNLSGKAVNYWMQKEKVAIENLLIIADDLALPFGTIRIKKQGGAAGHNGLSDIIEMLGHQEFNRLRFGIGDEFSKGQQVDYVLGDWTETENEKLEERIKKVASSIKSFVTIGIDRTMSEFNNK